MFEHDQPISARRTTPTRHTLLETPLLTDTDIRPRIWTELQRAVNDRHHEWRTPVLATVGADGLPQARTVVLRQALVKRSQLQIYTDSRSPKVAEMAATPGVMLTFWSKRLGWQLRVRATTVVQHTGPEVDAIWAKVSQSPAAGDYLSAHAPGELVGDLGVSEAASPRVAPAHHLCIVTAQVQSIDWLELARSGHRRAFVQADNWSWRVP